MSEFEVWVPVEIGRSSDVVWDALTSVDTFIKWWWGTDELAAVEPGFEVGGMLRFSSGWSTTITECLPKDALAFASHRFKLIDFGQGRTRLEWSQWVEGDPARDQLMGIDSARPFRERMTVALNRFKKLVETERVLVEVPSGQIRSQPEAAPELNTEQDVQHVRVFVSSTFADMVADRDELAQRSFMVLRQICRDRGVIFSDVDLRWGITDEQQAEGQVLPICLTEIDRCRPYFIGLLGERYGSTLSHIPDELLALEPWLAEHADRSVTELEILHGVLNNPELAEQSFFYFRDPGYIRTQPEEQQDRFRETPTEEEISRLGIEEAKQRAIDRQRRLSELKEVIQERFDVRTYRDPRELADFVVEDLTTAIEKKFPAGSAPTPDQREAARQAGYTAELRSIFIDRPELFAVLDDQVNGSGPPLVIKGEPGSGKSALLANWVQYHKTQYPETPVLSHFFSASARSSELQTMFRSLLYQIQRIYGFTIDIPDDIEALNRTFSSALFSASNSGKLVVVFDGADGAVGLKPEAPLAWLPHQLPAQVRVVVTTSPGPILDDAERRSWQIKEVSALDPEARERLITSYLDRFAKSLSYEHKERIIAHSHSANPRFLRVLLDELRWTGDYATLDENLKSYLSAAGMTELYGRVLDRCEASYERDRSGLVQDAACLLWASRGGLSEAELMELLGDGDERLPHALWSPFELGAEAIFTNRSGLITLRNHQVSQAVEAKYMIKPEQRRIVHLHLADYFSNSDDSKRRAFEMPWQLVRAEQWTELYDLLTNEQILLDIWNEEHWALQHYWAELTRHTSKSMAAGYLNIIEHPGKHPQSAGIVAQLLVNGGYLTEALPLARRLADQARAAGDAERLVVALNNLSPILAAQGDLEARMDCARELEKVAREAGHKKGIAGALANRAGVHVVRGELKRAAGLYREEQELRVKLGDRDGLQYCLGNQAQILVDQGDLDAAMNLRQEQERLSREIGNRHGLRIALGTQAVIHRMWGNLEMAAQLHQEEEQLCRETGDKSGLQASLGNRALVIQIQGDLETALEMFREQEKICRELGIRQDLATCLNNQAGILVQYGDLEGALRLYQEQEQICRQIEYDLGLQASLGNQGLLRMHLNDIEGAVDLFRKQEEICRRCGFPEYLAHCLNNLVMPLQILARQEEADAAAAEALELVERYNLSTSR